MHFLLLVPLRRRKYLSCPWSLKDNGGCSHHALCNFTPFMPRLSSYFSNDKSFPLVSLSLFQAHSCANNWLISCGSLEMSRCEVAFVVWCFGKAPLYLYALEHEVRLVLTQLVLFRRAFGVSTLPAYGPRSTSMPSCFMPKRPARYTATPGSGLACSPAVAGERPPHCASGGLPPGERGCNLLGLANASALLCLQLSRAQQAPYPSQTLMLRPTLTG